MGCVPTIKMPLQHSLPTLVANTSNSDYTALQNWGMMLTLSVLLMS